MKPKDLLNISAGIALGLLLAWLLGWWGQSTPPVQASTAIAPATSIPTKPDLETRTVPQNNVNLPTAPIAVVHQSAASASPSPTPMAYDNSQGYIVQNGFNPNSAQASPPTPKKAITNNLRMIASAVQTYMMDKGVTQANYYDVVGAGTDAYIHDITPVVGEDYTGLTFDVEQSEVTISTSLGDITYQM